MPTRPEAHHKQHLSFARLADLADGRLAPAEAVQAQAHVESCPRCAAEAAWLRRTIELMRDDARAGENAPAEDVARAVALFRRPAQRPAGLLRRLSAALQFDSALTPQPLGVRAGMRRERQLVFSAGSFELDLRILPAGERWAIAGQVLGPETGGEVTLSGAGGSETARLNELSEFRLAPVPAGAYALTIRLADDEVQIDEINIGA